MAGVSQDGFAAPPEAARLEPGRKERQDDTVRCSSGERSLRWIDRTKQRQAGAITFTQCSLRHLTFHLGDDGLRLSKAVEVLRYFAQLSTGNEMKAAIAPRSLYQLRGAGWRWRRRGCCYA